MRVSRRGLIGGGAALLPAVADAAGAQPGTLPDRVSFPFEGVYLDAAFTHPLGRFAAAAGSAYVAARLAEPQAVSPRQNPRRGAVERFARLINAAPADIAVVSSTLEGENLINAALGVGPGAGVVTDVLHYDASLVLYGEQAKRGAPVGVAPQKDGRVDLADIARLITPQTRLVAVSLVSSVTGFQHDLTELCAMAHAKGALVYADIVQAAGAVPIDVKASGVDFAACGTYKWLMGDFGTAFLYVRPDRLDRLKRVEVGWRQVRRQESHALPFEPPGPLLGGYELATGAAGLFEVSTPAWGALAVVSASLDYILASGVDAIAGHRQPLVDRLQEGLRGRGFEPLTPRGSRSPIVAFAVKDAEARFAARLKAEGIRISTYDHRIRISPSVYNRMDDVERLIAVLTR
ncbi:MAG: aminotransferase class V-fold PLP-dependent enzyme [Alphaproteobacteria bacterium]|nr:aminotransferase class V-fold PLP-dependent enzyme [Alphaproteobacteria bacterium]MBU1516763.1 aminotransferase class V-fold PLP-dependent enzyme [Alphaproteobacteria bacterium]MBU2092457.1 aminotransferase class V-fold PLP-dependent enzyme [Alphaproteobacteria bacterium]MBU2152412.1 aminotransferase class V-fold PLP-dependent enzyme [Alphaproteobacteria bacterium]MBU2305623.1 aminotransferase class V-fold PLP-dependent enzyme [Alphaproteobacteria bacterium]